MTKPCAMVFVKQALYLQNQCHLYICSMTHSPKWHGPAVYILHSNNLQWIKQKKEPLQETSCASAFGKLFLKNDLLFKGFLHPFPAAGFFSCSFHEFLLGFFMKRLQKASQKVPKGCHRAPLKQMGILSGKIALLLKSTIYIYNIRFLKRIARFQKNAELHVMLHLLKSCAFLWICTWQRHVYIYIHSKRMVAL